ncbi:MAG: spore coat protein [bacterium]|nr:spore coat protein [bacterium]
MRSLFIVLTVSLLFLLGGCSLPESTESEAGAETTVLPDWTEATHGDATPPNYGVVFGEDEVKRIDIAIEAEDWQEMLDDMTVKYGSFGSGDLVPGGGGPGGGGPGNFVDENPIFVPCQFFFEGKEWYYVGVRFKGNSSLKHSWSQGIWKQALKFDFDEFEEEYPEIGNQRFYGFRQLSMAGNYNDQSFLRDRVVPEIFREAGVLAPYTTYCRVYIDHGTGPVYFGLYTMIEVVDDTMLADQFGSDSGNCYKPDGMGATFADGTFNEDSFVKKNNEDDGDWSDIQALSSALHSETRTGNPGEWRSQLEAVFNVEDFLNWLAVNTVIQNWDTYGLMTHNYYLYNDTSQGLTWIPWDNNEALHKGKREGALSLDFTEVDSWWPLIRYLMDDETYRATYLTYVAAVINGPFEPTKMKARYRHLHSLIQPYVTGNDGEIAGHTFLNSSTAFDTALEELITHVDERKIAAEVILND